MALTEDGVDLEIKKFRSVGDSDDEVAVANLLHGTLTGGVKIPIKVVDDGSGLGKIVTTLE